MAKMLTTVQYEYQTTQCNKFEYSCTVKLL